MSEEHETVATIAYVLGYAILYIGYATLFILPILMLHVLLVNNDVDLFLTLFNIVYWIDRIMCFFVGLVLLLGAVIIRPKNIVDWIILGIIKLWIAIYMYPPIYTIIIAMATNTLTEPLPLVTLKLVLFYAIDLGINMAVNNTTNKTKNK